MDLFIPRLLMLGLGGAVSLWGALIVSYDQFYDWWRDRYWIEKDRSHLSKQSLFYNRYIDGLGALAIGITMVWVALG